MSFEHRGILDKRQVPKKGKIVVEYLVDWRASWQEPTGNEKIAFGKNYNKVTTVFGLLDVPANDKITDPMDKQFVLYTRRRDRDDKHSEVKTMTYAEVKKNYPVQLLEFFERHYKESVRSPDPAADKE